ncbi:hypothetical protein Taro_041696 [Colocasia esculenta]|uniref:Uncharacterized protein n=1 Tax=Colocasia esculenta TaxID=4460 RepID=A0A843WUB8_COLES|nr:hypothetical protein [Colocasia esculenta]
MLPRRARLSCAALGPELRCCLPSSSSSSSSAKMAVISSGTSRLVVIILALMAVTGSSLPSPSSRKTYIVLMDTTTVAALDSALAGTKRWYEDAMDTLDELSASHAHADPEAEEEEEGRRYEQEGEGEHRRAPRLLYVYENVISGFAAVLSSKHARSLPHLHGFLFASPDEVLLHLHTTHSPQFLGLVPGKGLWGSQTSASDVVVGLVDTGIWPEHVSFRDDYLSGVPPQWKGACEAGPQFSGANCNRKIVGARAFYRGYEATSGKINETLEFRSPRDSSGHGTHTASTAAGNFVASADMLGNAAGHASGIGHGARIAVYKACWSSGCASSDILAAVDRAVADGVNVLSLSLGGNAKPYHVDPLALAAFGAVEKGVFVSCSAGNGGPSPSTVSNTAPWITTVGASYLDRSFPTTVRLGDGRTFTGASLYTGRPTKRAQLVYAEKAGEEGDGAAYCLPGSLSRRLVRGKIVLCNRGLSGRIMKGEQVRLAGGLGMLLLNTRDQGEELFADPHVLPASSMGTAASSAIRDYANSSSRPTASITFHGTVYGARAPAMAAFSSRGPSTVSPDVIKPDITAPGMSILAAWPTTASPSLLKSDTRRVAFNIISGTSMSCPHVSGVAALLKSRHPGWSPAAIKSAMMTTASTLDNRGEPIGDVSTGSPASPFVMGSGHVSPETAADPGLVYDITTDDYLVYLCSLNYTSTQIMNLSRKNYSCPKNRDAQAGDLNYPSFSVMFQSGEAANATAAITFTRTVTNVGQSRCRYTVNVREPVGVGVTVEPRVLGFARMGKKLSYKVTFVETSKISGGSSFGELVWVCGAYSVRSPIAATWV